MGRCVYTEQCIFFTDEIGYSIDLQAHMRMEYCLTDNTRCARLLAMDKLPLAEIPDDLIPSELERLEQLTQGL